MPEPQEEIHLINKYWDHRNIAESLDQEELDRIGMRVVEEYEIDKASRSEWEERNKKGMKLAMQLWEEKNWPHEKASNVMYPLLSTAAIQFSSRAYPNIVQGNRVVMARVIGEDPDGVKAERKKRISEHMSYQCLEEMEEWETEMDKGLTILPILGCFFKKTYYSSELGRNISEAISPQHVVIHYFAKSLESAPRVTHVYVLYPNEIEERKRSKFFLNDVELGMPTSKLDEESEETIGNDDDQPHVFLEQYRWLDLDDDGYKEPYTVIVHKDTKKVIRIKARYDLDGIHRDGKKIIKIDPVHYLTKFPFLRSPDGSVYEFGFGSLLGPINETINTTTNQLIDAGTKDNAQCGFLGGGVNLGRGRGGGNVTLKLNEWMPVPFSGDDLRKQIFPLPTKGPSAVLFNLLGFMVEAGEKQSSVSEILTGDQSIHNEPATTTLARIEQGLKVFSGIHKRIYKASKSEYRKLYRLNRLYLEQEAYYVVLDSTKAIVRADYEDKSIDVVPVADPNQVSDTQKLLKAQILYGLKGQGFNDRVIDERYLEALQIENYTELLMPEDYEPPPDPKTVLETEKLDLKRDELEFKMSQYPDERAETLSKIIKNLANAEAAEVGPQMEYYKTEMNALIALDKNKQAAQKPKAGAANVDNK